VNLKISNSSRVGAVAAALVTAFAVAVPASASAASASAGLAHAEKVVAQYSKPLSSYKLPAGKVSGVSKLKGKKVMFIPLLDQIQAFQITRGGLTAALKTAGISVTDCNGQANPSGVQTCINQAESGGYAAVITDAIPYEMAATSFQSAESHHIPVLITDQLAESRYEKKDVLAYQPGNINQPTLIADWMIADSKGKAKAVVTRETDSPSSAAYVTAGMLPEFKNNCPGCKITTANTPSAGVTSQWVETQIKKDPGVQYYYSEFEDDLAPTTEGVSLAGVSSSLKVSYASATIAGLTDLKNHKQVYAEVGDDVTYEGWADADEVLRMIGGQPTVSENTPERIFTRSNIGSIKLTNANQNSGVWYGSPSLFQSGFEKLWGTK
jgi:ribose transport system substrate-binding protein